MKGEILSVTRKGEILSVARKNLRFGERFLTSHGLILLEEKLENPKF